MTDTADRHVSPDPTVAYRTDRSAMLAADNPVGPAAREALVLRTDAWLAELFDRSDAVRSGAALVAVGGYGRRQLSPGSDLDLLLLHPPGQPIDAVAEQLFYPVWDAGLRLDHSVRTVAEARALAGQDLRVILGLLDMRLLAGDPELARQLRQAVLADWRAQARERLPELHRDVIDRAARSGELPYLLEPDLKESFGGIRDVVVLRAIAASWVTDLPHRIIDAPHRLLLDTRDALHLVTGRASDRLMMQEHQPVARALGFLDAADGSMTDSDAMLRGVLGAGRAIAFAADLTWHRVEQLVRKPSPATGPGRRSVRGERAPLIDGVVVQDGEAVLALDARPGRDPVLVLRAAAGAAQAGLRLAPHTVARLAAESAPMPVPWPPAARDAFVSLLGAGRALLPVWEELDQAGLMVRLIPGWDVVRSAPQHNPIHRFTVDRHLVEAAIQAGAYTRMVRRPDLLLVGALMHDIGKGRAGDHSEVGVALVRSIGPHLGFDDEDTDTLAFLVEHHLLLPDIATRRDLEDPATVAAVAATVGTHERLDLLHALARADARATGPASWSEWRESLVDDLVTLTHAALRGNPLPASPRLATAAKALAHGTGLQVLVEPGGMASDGSLTITVAAPDRVGLLAIVAGVFAVHRLQVRAAQLETLDGRAVQVWTVAPQFGDPPAWDRVREDIRRGLDGSLDVAAALGRREAVAPAPSAPAPSVEVVPDASDRATVIEVRAHDTPTLLHRVARAIASADANVTAAIVSTLGADALDTFYLIGRDGSPLSPGHAAAVRITVLVALEQPVR